MKLKDILKGINYELVSESYDLDINKIAYDSRKVEKGDLFVCIEGYNVDGHKFMISAVEKGAAAVLCSKLPEDISIFKGVVLIRTENTRKGLAVCASNYYDNPSKKLKIIGITGTSGKTTSTFLMKYILEEAGFKVGLIGTIQNYIGDKKIPSSRTTPESLELQQMFSEMVKNRIDYCVMEVSSHSLYLNRVYGIEFSQGIFTNLSQDHLDFHKTFENYYQAKLLLFKNSKNLIINIDDGYGKRILDDLEGKKLTYGVSSPADITAENARMHSKGIDFDIVYGEKRGAVSLNLPGKYNIYNALCAAAACINEGVPFEEAVRGLSDMPGVPGRCELVSKNYNIDYDIIIDYAHAPAELENILKTVKEFTKGRLITVFGCGGDRDKTKRAEMGQIGTRLSDKVIITSDNPRSEEPLDIISDIVKGTDSNNYIVIEDRKAAIKKAIEIARKDDVIVIAGKGHEDYQELKEGKVHFDEREVISDIFKAINC